MAWSEIRRLVNGEEEDSDDQQGLNENYWKLKEGSGIEISTGFRVYDGRDGTFPLKGKTHNDAASYDYSLSCFCEGSGATALLASATAFIALFLF